MGSLVYQRQTALLWWVVSSNETSTQQDCPKAQGPYGQNRNLEESQSLESYRSIPAQGTRIILHLSQTLTLVFPKRRWQNAEGSALASLVFRKYLLVPIFLLHHDLIFSFEKAKLRKKKNLSLCECIDFSLFLKRKRKFQVFPCQSHSKWMNKCRMQPRYDFWQSYKPKGWHCSKLFRTSINTSKHSSIRESTSK